MKTIRIILISAVIWILFQVLTGCKADPNYLYIQGSWVNLNEHLQDIAAEQELETFWHFQGNRYEMSACCFSKVYEKGKFFIVESSQDSITLELQPSSGHINSMPIDPQTHRVIKITIDSASDSMRIQSAVFTRYLPKKE